jgi:glycosyltransferase involved in cell wall biosynthesis
MTQKTSLGVVVPCYNEERNVDHFEAEMAHFLNHTKLSFPLMDVKFYIIDNNCTDSTPEKLQGLVSRHQSVEVLKCGIQGYGAALKHGFTAARNHHFVSFLDFDNTYPMVSILDLLSELKNKNLDLIYGARLHAQSEIELIRRIGNTIYVKLMSLLIRSPLSDVCSGMRVFRSEHVDSVVSLNSDDLAFSIHLTTHAILNRWRIGEVPIQYRKRVGSSKLSLVKDGTRFLLIIIKAGLFGKH